MKHQHAHGTEPAGLCLSANTDRTLGPPTWMTAGNSSLNLLDLPVEVLEDVVLRLRVQEIPKLRIVMSFLLLLRSRWFLAPNVDYTFTPFSSRTLLAESRISRHSRRLSGRAIPHGPFLGWVGGRS